MDIVKKYGASLAVLFFLLLAGCEENGPAPKRGFLWKVTHGNETAYLFGGFPIGVESLLPLSGDVYEALDKADSVYTADIGKRKHGKFYRQFDSLKRDENQPVEGKEGEYKGISDAYKAKLIKIIGKEKYDEGKDNFEPYAFIWDIAVEILSKQPFLLGQDSIKLEFSPNWAILKRVRDTRGVGGNIPRNSLDSLDYILTMATIRDTLSPAEQIIHLENFIDRFDRAREERRKLVEFYKGGRIDKIVQFLGEDKQRKNTIFIKGRNAWEVFEVNRNKGYAKKIADVLKRKKGHVSFMAIDITSLLGEDGTIEELKRTLPGVRVERVVP